MNPRTMLLACAITAGCSDAVVSASIVSGGSVVGVSGDQRYVAYMVGEGGTPMTGSLWVKPLPDGAPVHLADNAYNPGFGRTGHAVYFLVGPTPRPAGGFSGRLYLWTPELGAAVRVTQGFDEMWAEPPDYSVDLFVEAAEPGGRQNADVRLLRTAECTRAACAPATLASGVNVRRVAISRDGRSAAFVREELVDGVTSLTTWFVRTADGTTTRIATTPLPSLTVATRALVDFSPDGARVAVLTSRAGAPLQPEVLDTATLAPVALGALPSVLQCIDLTFSDADTLFVETVDASSNRSVYRLDATSAIHVAQATYFFIRRDVPGAERYLFHCNATDESLATGALTAWTMIDLRTGASTVLTRLGTAPVVSDDLTTALFAEDLDAEQQFGSVYVAPLSGGQPLLVERSLYLRGVSFARGAHALLYFATPQPGATGAEVRAWVDGRASVLDPNARRYVTAEGPSVAYITRADPTSGALSTVRRPIM